MTKPNDNRSRRTKAGMDMRTASLLVIRMFQVGKPVPSGRERNLKRT